MTLDEFEHQLRWIKNNGFHTLNSIEFQHCLSGERKTGRDIVITFDDGYRDTYYLAAPLLRKYGMNALLFIITGKIKQSQPGPVTSTWLEEGDERYLSWQEVRDLSDSGTFDIHSHSHTHDSSWRQQTPGENIREVVRQDIATSVRTLREQGYLHDLHLAWPWGYFRNEWLEDLPPLGINHIHTTRPGTNFAGCDTRTIARLNAHREMKMLTSLCTMGSSPVCGKMLNGASQVWRYLRNHP